MRRTNYLFFSKQLVFVLITSFTFFSFSKDNKDKPYVFPEVFYFPKMPVNISNPVTINGIELGRHLFYDPIFSADSTISCSSCHDQKFAFSDSPNKFSKGMNQQIQQRNTLPLFNLAWYETFFWDGRVNSIEDQIFHPVRTSTEMNSNWTEVTKRIKRNKLYKKLFYNVFGNVEIDSVLVSKAIAQFERTLISYNSKYDKVIRNEAKYTIEELEGFELVNDLTKGSCLHCHTTDANGLGTTGGFSNNGLDEITDPKMFADKGLGSITKKINDNGKFKIPSLRNLLFTAPYMHDGRFNTLEEVLDFYSDGLKNSTNIDSKMVFVHQGGSKLNKYEKKKIIAFLKTLSDSTFVSNKNFSDPFVKH